MPDLFRSPAERQRAREERELRYGEIKNEQSRPGHPGEYIADIVPPPDYLTPDQLDLFDALGEVDDDLSRGGGGVFTSEQLRNWTASGFQWVCQLEGVEVPEVEAVLAEIDLRHPGWPGHWTEPRRVGPPLPHKQLCLTLKAPSKTAPELAEALYTFPPGWGPFGPR